jgi:hypothetical protein
MERKIENQEITRGVSVEYSSAPLFYEQSALSSDGSGYQVSSTSTGTVSQITHDLLALAGGSERTVVASQNFDSRQIGGVTLIDNGRINSIEQAIIRSNNPVEINETEVLTVHGNTGIWLNRSEIVNWKGEIPITQYSINEDNNPEIIKKQTEQKIIYDQEVAVRYLRPPTPPPPGEIIIRQELNAATPPAPPLIIRQQPPRPETPPPLVIREAPPRPPAAVGQKVITISGKRLPPPPRKVVIERLAPMPNKPQSALIERWLPYTPQKRKVVFQKNLEADPIIAKPKNVIIQWDAPDVQIKKTFKDLGVLRANPVEYVERYGASLKTHLELPPFVKEIKPPAGVVLAADYTAPSYLELEGDIQALNYIDFEREGLAEYRTYLARLNQTTVLNKNVSSSLNKILLEIFQSVDQNASGQISRNEAEALLLKLNIRLGRNYTQADASEFVRVLDINGDGVISFEEFRNAILKQFL